MSRVRVSFACTVTDRTRPILEGRVPIEGCEIEPTTGEPEDLFARALQEVEFDITELSLSSYLVVLARGESPYVAVPVFPSRAFRHSAVYVRTDRGIDRPEDLAGMQIGVPEFQQTTALWVRGILADRHGVAPADIRWQSGGLERPGGRERIAIAVREGIELRPIDPADTLSGMLAEGRLDGLVSPRPPSCFLEGHPRVRRLWPDFRDAERSFYRETGLFPIMHVVAIRRNLAEGHPSLPTSVFTAFAEAKRLAISDLEQTNFLRVTLPWVDLDDVRGLMGHDFWPYGLEANRPELEAASRWSFAEGLAERRLETPELFHPATHDLRG
ncbi:MAG TPA: ABC transporter substrate-binding protein [Actinomycetota bacterium]|nr:ABC transporter substrate-binding protein [Actinomycetota bacterium]